MDPRSHPSRPPSTSLPQGSTPMSSTPIASMPMHQYNMQPQYPVSQPHTLPPLQPHHGQSPAPHPYMGQPYRPDLSRYPNATTHDVYASSTAPMMPHTSVGSLPPSSFLSHHSPQPQHQPPQNYPPPHGLPSASGTQAYPQPIAPAPPRDRRSDYSNLPSGAFSYSDGKPPTWVSDPANGMNGTPPYATKEPPRTQVVGSQGRRGILPSVPGRASPVVNGANGSPKNATIPPKDADGKFPCPNCNKTYLHAKHLKRHLLRHTGDRPYMCVLCKDTFSRSDILKRHFQKCSIRRGNPTGATHLSHPHSNLKKAQAQAAANPAKPLQDEVSSRSIPPPHGGAGTAFGEGPVNGSGLASGRPGFTEQPPLGFSMPSVNGMNRGPPDGAFPPGQPQRESWMAAPKQNPYLVQPGPDSSSQQLNTNRSSEQVKPPMIHDTKRPMMPGPHQPENIDWTSMFHPGAPDGYMNSVFQQSMPAGHVPMHAPVEPDRKFYPATTVGHEGGMNGLYMASTMASDGAIPHARQ